MTLDKFYNKVVIEQKYRNRDLLYSENKTSKNIIFMIKSSDKVHMAVYIMQFV